MTNLVEIKHKRNDGAIEIMRRTIEGLESGEITGVSLVVEYRDGTYQLDGSDTMSRLQTIGLLFELAVKRME